MGIAPRFSCTLRSLRTFLGISLLVISLLVIACGGSSPQRKTAGHADAPDDRPPSASSPSSPSQPDGSAASPKPSTGTSNDLSAACKRPDMFGPFELDGEQTLRRRGLGDRRFSDTVSSVEAPIEVCGTYGELSWLLRMTCADGSKPFGTDWRKAHATRAGSRPGKPRCGGSAPMIDLYEVPCPEQRYAVYMDLYECGPGEDLLRTMK